MPLLLARLATQIFAAPADCTVTNPIVAQG